ncbi:MAG: succinylglutamate desuccinylase/aspartoacylase family protein [Gammaproteobacteria bacterium]|nr:succinylglutamate desuccinylase/aspartoacylase family protein [Gammaproteobacteria bacterium]
MLSAEVDASKANVVRNLLGMDIPPGTTTRVNWSPSRSFAGIAVDTPVLVVNGAMDGPTLCLIAAIHGDELNGIEMVRRVLYDLNPEKLRGMVVGVPIVNLLGFSRNSRYLPDRRDLNRYFPGNATGSMASRLAHTFFNDVVRHCNALVDLHTGSFYRTNITQLRADLSVPEVAEFAALFGDIPVLNTPGNRNSLRAAAVRAGIPTVTVEAGEPMRMQTEVVAEGVVAINNLLNKNGMYRNNSFWAKPEPAFYRSAWVRANTSGILFSEVKLGANINKGDVLGRVINPVSNEQKPIVSKFKGRVLGMALDQFVLPGFAAYHIGIRARDAQKLVDAMQPSESSESAEHDSDSLDDAAMPAAGDNASAEEGFDD